MRANSVICLKNQSALASVEGLIGRESIGSTRNCIYGLKRNAKSISAHSKTVETVIMGDVLSLIEEVQSEVYG
jgi:hypothetical protein